MSTKEIRDAVHGDVDFDSPELDVINTPQFQRMRGIRQLGLAHLVYPSAQHSRFEHSLGVVHMAERIVQAVHKNGGEIDENERRFVRALALTHDIGHIPFGHTLEDERPVFGKDEHHDHERRLDLFFKETELGNALNALGANISHANLVEDLIRVMKRTHEEEETGKSTLTPREELFAAIVGNTICADLLDYLKRDPYFTGLQHRYDDRIVAAFKIDGDQIYLDLDDRGRLKRSIVSEILHLLRLRYTLGERVYYHLTKSAASAMISKAVELSGLSHRAIAPLRDEELLFALETSAPKDCVGGETVHNVEQVRRLVKGIRTRKLYVPVYTITLEAAGHNRDGLVSRYHDYSNLRERRKAEETLARRIGASPEQVIIYCPDKGMSTKAAMVKVRWPKDNRLLPLQELCEKEVGIEDDTIREEISQLKRKHTALWQMNVFLDPDCLDRASMLSAHCQAEFYNIPNTIPDYADAPIQAIRYKLILEAMTRYPEPDKLDVAACGQLMTSEFFDRKDAWTVEEMSKLLPRKPQAGGESQASLLPPEPDSPQPRKGKKAGD